MSLRLLLDEDSQASYLVNLLQTEKHEVLTVNEAKLRGQPDPVVLNYTKQQNYVLLTRNCGDFQKLHSTNLEHFGILAVHQSADASKNMSYRDIVRAITNLEKAELPLAKLFVILNQ